MVASFRGVLYTGVTSELAKRGDAHGLRISSQFASKYNATKLVYAEPAYTAEAAFAREKQIKRWNRRKKVTLLESINPYWEDISDRVS